MEQNPQTSPEPQISPVRFPQSVSFKIQAIRGVLSGAELINPEQQEFASNAGIIDANLQAELADDNSASQEILRRHLSPTSSPDIFELEHKAVSLVDVLVNGTQQIDQVDFVVAIRSYDLLERAAVKNWSESTRDRQNDRSWDLGTAVAIELASRMPLINRSGNYKISDIYQRLFGSDTSRDSGYHEFMGRVVDTLYAQVDERRELLIKLAGVNTLLPPASPEQDYSTYNRPLSENGMQSLNRIAAETIERTHMLKAYDVAPMIVPADTVDLPWDIAVHPPLEPSADGLSEEYAPGALADFLFLPPDPNREHAFIDVQPTEGQPTIMTATVGGVNPAIRLRLHDNGQISFGHMSHNVPGDQVENIFAMVKASSAFVRLRGLLIAIAFDAVAPDEIVRENAGGSVARRFNELRAESSGRDPITELLLPRYRELRRAGITKTNGLPAGWEKPTKGVVGHMKRLPEGSRRRPTAEAEARAHYEKLGRKFDGLPEGMNFVGNYKRGTGPEDTTFRRAIFRGKSATAKHLGNLGVKGKEPKRKGKRR